MYNNRSGEIIDVMVIEKLLGSAFEWQRERQITLQERNNIVREEPKTTSSIQAINLHQRRGFVCMYVWPMYAY